MPARQHAEWFDWLFSAPLTRQLRYLTIWGSPTDVAGFHGLLTRYRLDALRLALRVHGFSLRMDLNALTVELDEVQALRRHQQTLRNLAPRMTPFPYRELAVSIGGQRATRAQVALLGEVFPCAVVSAGWGERP